MVDITLFALTSSLQALSRLIDEEDAMLTAMEEGDESYALAESVETWRKAFNELAGAYRVVRDGGADLPPLDVLTGKAVPGE